MAKNILENIEAQFPRLTRQLQQAARFVVDNPKEIAVRSMRSAAQQAGVHPNAMIRLAREFGFESYEPFRELFRDWLINDGSSNWVARARSVRGLNEDTENLVKEYFNQELINLQATFDGPAIKSLDEAAKVISEAKTVYIAATRTLFSVSLYFHTACRMFMSNTVLVTSLANTFADDLRNISSKDVIVAFSQQPYAKDMVRGVKFAREAGARLVALTDSKVSPIADPKSITIVVPNQSRSLIPTLVPTLAMAQALITILLKNGGDETMNNLATTESQLKRFDVYQE